MPDPTEDDKKKGRAPSETGPEKPLRVNRWTVGLGMANDVSTKAYFLLNPGTSYDGTLYTDGQLSHQNSFEAYNNKHSFTGNWSIYTPHLKAVRNHNFVEPTPGDPFDMRLEEQKHKYLSPNLIGERPYVGVFDVSAAKINHAPAKDGVMNYTITGAQVFMHDFGKFTENLQNSVHTNSRFPIRDYSQNPGERELIGANLFAERAHGRRTGSPNGIQAEAIGAIGGSVGVGMRDYTLRDISMKYATNVANAGLTLNVGQHLDQLPIESLPIGAENATTHHFNGTAMGGREAAVAWKLGARYVQSVSLSNHTMIPERDIKTPAPQYPASSGIQNVPFLHTNPQEPDQNALQKFGMLAGNVDLTATLKVKRVLAEFGVTVPVNDPTSAQKELPPAPTDKIITPRFGAKVAYRF